MAVGVAENVQNLIKLHKGGSLYCAEDKCHWSGNEDVIWSVIQLLRYKLHLTKYINFICYDLRVYTVGDK